MTADKQADTGMMDVRASMKAASTQKHKLKPTATWDVEICWWIKRSRRSGQIDMDRFLELVNDNLEEILDRWPIRWMVSIADTLAEHGSGAALVITAIWTMEKISNVSTAARDENARAANPRTPDAHRNLFRRMTAVSTEAEWKMFARVWRRLKEDPESIVARFYEQVVWPGELPDEVEWGMWGNKA
jgi:hypothetical protein